MPRTARSSPSSPERANLAGAVPLRMPAHHEGFVEHDVLGSWRELLGLLGIERDGLFAQHVLAGLRRGRERHRDVQVVGQRVVDGVDIGVGEQLFVAASGPWPCR